MQEEGWVVCKAFKKPNPNQKQGFEAWNNGYYIRNTHNNIRPHQPTNDTSNPSRSFHTNLSTNLYQRPFCDPEQLSANHFVLKTPNNDSPSASRSVPIDIDRENENRTDFTHYDNYWKHMDNLLESELDETKLFPYSNMPLIVHNEDNNELDSCDQSTHLYGCFF